MKFYEQFALGVATVYVCQNYPENRFELRLDQNGVPVELDLAVESARLILHDCVVNCKERCSQDCEVRELRNELERNGY